MKSLFRPHEKSAAATALADRLSERETEEKLAALISTRTRELSAEPPVTRAPEPVPATKGLATNLQRAVDLYEQRANQLQCTIDAATSERSDVIKARDAAKLALEALVTDVMEAAVESELAMETFGDLKS